MDTLFNTPFMSVARFPLYWDVLVVCIVLTNGLVFPDNYFFLSMNFFGTCYFIFNVIKRGSSDLLMDYCT